MKDKKVISDLVSIIIRIPFIGLLLYLIMNFSFTFITISAFIFDISIIYIIMDNHGSINSIFKELKNNNKKIDRIDNKTINKQDNKDINNHIRLCISKCLLLDDNIRLIFYKELKKIIDSYNDNNKELTINRLISFEYKINCILDNNYEIKTSKKVLSLKKQ